MKSTTLALASLLAATAVAQPHRHQQLHKKRQEVTWVTEWDYVTETVDVTTTVWVSSGFIPPTTSAEAVSTTSTSAVPAEFFEGPQSSSSSSSSVDVAPTPSTTSISVAPTPSSTYVAPSSSAVDVAPAESSSSSSVVYVPETTSAAPVYVAPTTTSEAPAAAATTASSSSSDSSSSSSGGASSGCTSGSPCTGDITYYTAGLGACGWTNDGDTENVVALPHELMGTQSNGNPYCGQTITVKCSATGKTTTAKVVDKCMGCTGDSIDLSNAAFLDLDDLSVGRTTAEWWFN